MQTARLFGLSVLITELFPECTARQGHFPCSDRAGGRAVVSSPVCNEAAEAQRKGVAHPSPSEPASSKPGAHSPPEADAHGAATWVSGDVQHPWKLPFWGAGGISVGPLECFASQGPLQGGQVGAVVVQFLS